MLMNYFYLLCVCVCVCFSLCVSSEHSCDVDSAPEGELRLPVLSPADAACHLHPTVNSLSAPLCEIVGVHQTPIFLGKIRLPIL